MAHSEHASQHRFSRHRGSDEGGDGAFLVRLAQRLRGGDEAIRQQRREREAVSVGDLWRLAQGIQRQEAAGADSFDAVAQ